MAIAIRRSLAASTILGVTLVALLAAGAATRVLAQEQAAVEVPALSYEEPLNFTDAARALLADPGNLPLPVRQRRKELEDFYIAQSGEPIWRNAKLRQRFLERLQNAEDDGLRAADYPIESLLSATQLNRFAMGRGAKLRHEAEVEFYWSAFFLKFAADIKVGRFLPTKVDPGLFWQPKDIDMVAALQLVSTLRDVDKFLDAWQPQIPGYLSLKNALREYRAIAKAGGWPKVPHGELLKPGMTSPMVPPLRARLAVTDGAATQVAEEAAQVYDENLVAAVKRFQARHGLDIDGVVGKRTVFQLNIPVEVRVRQIILSMERWRWMPEDLGSDYIKVNIAAFQLRRVRNDNIIERMRVVVGKTYHQTPVFSKNMTYVEINPYWNVPRSIATKEELPKLKVDPAARAAKGFEALSGDKVIPLTAIDWSKYSANNFPFRLRQKPGPLNALGTVKFMFPNTFNVYMHDTPARSLFANAERAYSHGCIRLARPHDMAEQVLAQVPGWTRVKIDETLASGKRTVVKLKREVPVHVTYSTAWRDRDGDVQFRPDIYRRDSKLYNALFGKPSPY